MTDRPTLTAVALDWESSAICPVLVTRSLPFPLSIPTAAAAEEALLSTSEAPSETPCSVTPTPRSTPTAVVPAFAFGEMEPVFWMTSSPAPDSIPRAAAFAEASASASAADTASPFSAFVTDNPTLTAVALAVASGVIAPVLRMRSFPVPLRMPDARASAVVLLSAMAAPSAAPFLAIPTSTPMPTPTAVAVAFVPMAAELAIPLSPSPPSIPAAEERAAAPASASAADPLSPLSTLATLTETPAATAVEVASTVWSPPLEIVSAPPPALMPAARASAFADASVVTEDSESSGISGCSCPPPEGAPPPSSPPPKPETFTPMLPATVVAVDVTVIGAVLAIRLLPSPPSMPAAWAFETALVSAFTDEVSRDGGSGGDPFCPPSSPPSVPTPMLPATAIDAAWTFSVPWLRISSPLSPPRIPAVPAVASADAFPSTSPPTLTSMDPAPTVEEAFTFKGPMLTMALGPLPPEIPTASALAVPEASPLASDEPPSSPATPTPMLPAPAIEADSTVRVPSLRIASLPSPPRIPAVRVIDSADTSASAPVPTPTEMEPAPTVEEAFTVKGATLTIVSWPGPPPMPSADASAFADAPAFTGDSSSAEGPDGVSAWFS